MVGHVGLSIKNWLVVFLFQVNEKNVSWRKVVWRWKTVGVKCWIGYRRWTEGRSIPSRSSNRKNRLVAVDAVLDEIHV